jgi:hypothetical protein
MRRRLAFWRAWWRWAWRGLVLITLSWALTLPNTFPAHYESLPDGDAILVLDAWAQPSS